MNHFVVIDCRGRKNPSEEYLRNLAKIFCATPMADDMLVLQDSSVASVRLRVFGKSGEEADFCGNGMIYVSAKIGEEMKIDRVKIESASGVKSAVQCDGEWEVEVGPAIALDHELESVPASILQGMPIFGLVRAGEPHLVMDEPAFLGGFHMHRKDFEDYCRPLRDMTGIKGGLNITMVFENKDRRILIRTYERGAQRQTFSCGTGSVSAAAVLYGIPGDGSVFDICSPGGRHTVIYEQNCWYLKAAPQRISIGYLANSHLHLPLAGLSPYIP